MIELAGSEGTKHHTGMTRPFWRAISGLPECFIGSLGLTTEATPLLPRKPIPVADGFTYLPRKTLGRPAEEATLEFAAPGNRAVLVTNVLGGYEHFEPIGALAGNEVVEHDAASSINFSRSLVYGLGVIRTSVAFRAWRWGLARPRIFEARPEDFIPARGP
jgi:hypothetical protein